MKALVCILLITVVTASVFADENKGELDGKALECLHGKLPVTVSYWIFDNLHVYTPLVTRELPRRIQRDNTVEYSSTPDTIRWKTSAIRSIRYTLDKKTLRLKRHYRSKELSDAKCKILALTELEARYQIQIEQLNEEMKDSKN